MTRHGDHDRVAKPRYFWIVIAAIVVITVGITLLFALKLQREHEVWEMNPPRFIVPLDHTAEKAVAGDVDGALADIEQRLNLLRGIVEDSDVSFRRLGLYRDWDLPDTVITVIDIEMLLVLDCLIRKAFMPAAADALFCDWAGRNVFDYRMERGLHNFTRAFLLEAKGRDPAFIAALYRDSGSTIAEVVTGWGIYDDDPARREIAARVLDFARARTARLIIIADGPDGELRDINTANPWCSSQRDEVCSGGVATYHAITAYLQDDDPAAINGAQQALKGAQPWVYPSPYEHPLLWLLAASRRSGIDVDREPLQLLIDAALSHWPIDARLALAVMIDGDSAPADDDEPAWSTCTTPGCLFFLTEYFTTIGDTARAETMRAEGLALCEDMQSIPCMALRRAAAS